MTRTLLHPFGWGSLVGGIVAATIGMLSGSELGGLAWTYGVLVVLAATYLLVGLRIRAALASRRTEQPSPASGRQAEASGA